MYLESESALISYILIIFALFLENTIKVANKETLMQVLVNTGEDIRD